MSWFRVDDDLPQHVKTDALEAAAGSWEVYAASRTLWEDMGCDCSKRRTDGRFVRARALRVCRMPAEVIDKALTALVTAGFLEVAGGEYAYHDWADYQPTKAELDEQRKAATERQRKRRMGLSQRDTAVTHATTTGVTTAVSQQASQGESRPASHERGAGTSAVRVTAPRPVPSRPEIGITHTPREGGPPRLGTVELFGLTGEDVVNALRVGAKGRVNLAHDSRTLADLGDLVRDLAAQPESTADLAAYQALAAWVGAGGLAWYDHGAPTLAYLLKPGVLAQHLAEAAQWHREGRPAIKTRKAAASDAASRGNPRSSYVGPIPPAPREAFEHATLAAKLGLRWKAPTDGSDRDAAWLSQHGFSVDEARARVAALPNARTGT